VDIFILSVLGIEGGKEWLLSFGAERGQISEVMHHVSKAYTK